MSDPLGKRKPGSVQCCFTSTVRTIRDGEPRTATSTFTQLLNSVETMSSSSTSVLLYVHRDRTGRRAQDSYIDFHTAPELCGNEAQVQRCFTSTETESGTESPGQPPGLSHSSSALWKRGSNSVLVGWVLLYVHRNRRLIRDGDQDGHLDFHTAPGL